MSAKTLLTADDLARMPDDDSVQLELDEGELISMPPAGFDHGEREDQISFLLNQHVRKNKLGKVLTGDTGFRLNDNTVLSPDVAFVRKDRVEALRSKSFAKGAPDLAVEILSPSDTVRRVNRKVKQYLAAGCHTVWLVYPESQTVDIFEASGAERTLHSQEILEAQEILPGFSAKVADLFA